MGKTAFFIRHGESLANIGIACPDPASVPLTDFGKEQAAAVAEWFEIPPELIIHSSYSRTYETAKPLILKYPETPVEEWPVQEFTYLDTVECANTTPTERRERALGYWSRMDPRYVDGYGTESFSAMLSRLRDVLLRMESVGATRIAVFSHSRIIHVLSLLERFPESDDLEIMTRLLAEKPHFEVQNAEIWETRILSGRLSGFEKRFAPKQS